MPRVAIHAILPRGDGAALVTSCSRYVFSVEQIEVLMPRVVAHARRVIATLRCLPVARRQRSSPCLPRPARPDP